ncbi:serine hydrolase domain-containing protein [Streptomyces sp. NRRL S-920]|uniref:serine hydrolase domain-containing protein n=1 Tax=Streptomyces sp. NRRL S-920 TaxID=1463921 RepID=UPI00055E9552|nr:serine hydrolase domain-containing protein [Streptomyces sp. NRRL S-920]
MSVPCCVISHRGIRTEERHNPGLFVETGSLTKVITGTALIQLADEGVLEPDDPLERWLPAATGTGITLRHLLQHTSGLPRLPPKLPGHTVADPYRQFTPSALDDLLGQLPNLLLYPPGQHEEYSNLGYAILGAALTAATGHRYQDIVDEYVLAPLQLPAGAMTPYPPADARLLPRTRLFKRPGKVWTMDGAILPAGGLWATPHTIASLARGLIVDQELGLPAPTWYRNGNQFRYNGATSTATVSVVAQPAGPWAIVHRLGGDPAETARIAVEEVIRV